MPEITGFRDWNFDAGTDNVLGQRLREGYDIGAATAVNDPSNMTAFEMAAVERDEQFNTRISGYIGWEQAARKLIPTPRRAAQFDLTRMVLESGSKTTGDAVDNLLWRLVRVPLAHATRESLVSFLTRELGTDSLDRAKTYMEDPLRMTVHLIMRAHPSIRSSDDPPIGPRSGGGHRPPTTRALGAGQGHPRTGGPPGSGHDAVCTSPQSRCN